MIATVTTTAFLVGFGKKIYVGANKYSTYNTNAIISIDGYLYYCSGPMRRSVCAGFRFCGLAMMMMIP